MIEVRVTNYTSNPIKTVCDLWRSTHPHETRTEDELWEFISKSNLPILEFISFNFEIKNVCIAWREQLVRNRNSAYWIQSGRETIVDTVATDGNYFIPDSIQNNQEALEIYVDTWQIEQEAYNRLIELGIDPGDARLIIGTGMNHLVNLSTDYRNLISIIGSRLCHIAQASLWKDVIIGIRSELDKIDPRLIKPLLPQCYTTGKCKFDLINKTRLDTVSGLLNKDNGGDFSGTPCPRWKSLNGVK